MVAAGVVAGVAGVAGVGDEAERKIRRETWEKRRGGARRWEGQGVVEV